MHNCNEMLGNTYDHNNKINYDKSNKISNTYNNTNSNDCSVYNSNNTNTNNMNSINNNANDTSFVSCNVPSAGTNSRCTGFDDAGFINNIIDNNNQNVYYHNRNNFINKYAKQDSKEQNYNVRNGNNSFTSGVSNNIYNNNISSSGNNHNFNVPNNHSDTNLFFRHLPNSIDDSALRHIFSVFGSVLSAAIMRDIHTGESLGTAFVRF